MNIYCLYLVSTFINNSENFVNIIFKYLEIFMLISPVRVFKYEKLTPKL